MTQTTEETTTLCDAFAATAAADADEPALRAASGSVVWTWREYADHVRAAAAGLHGVGVRRGDTVAPWLSNRPEFHVPTPPPCSSAPPVSVYSTFTVAQAEHVVGDAGSRVLVTEPAYLEHAIAIRARGNTAVELIVLVEGASTNALSWDDLLAAAPPSFDAAAAEVSADDLATLIYTSGTTGAPKGVELTHGNVVEQCAALREALGLARRQRAISWLPMAHIAERLCTHYIGMSETTGVATVNAPDAVRIGTVGRALPGVEVALSATGEVLMRGPVVMRGYRNRPDATAEALDVYGWMHSGDIDVFDDDGYLRIVDRIKELIINAAGKNMSPTNIEATIKSAGSAIGCVCAIGDARPYNVALVTLDAEAAATCCDPEAEVAAQIDRANEKLARAEQIKRFALLPVDWVPDGDELTPTMKLKRKPIAEKYAAEIETLYAKEAV